MSGNVHHISTAQLISDNKTYLSPIYRGNSGYLWFPAHPGPRSLLCCNTFSKKSPQIFLVWNYIPTFFTVNWSRFWSFECESIIDPIHKVSQQLLLFSNHLTNVLNISASCYPVCIIGESPIFCSCGFFLLFLLPTILYSVWIPQPIQLGSEICLRNELEKGLKAV